MIMWLIMLMIMHDVDQNYGDLGMCHIVVWMMYSLSAFKSFLKYIYHHQWWPFPTEPSLVKGDGDGTVNIRSLKVILR